MTAPDLTITVDGRPVRAADGVTVAAALLDAGVHAFRRSVQGGARAPLCGMGICHECRVTIDGVPHRRACLVPVAPHMVVRTAERTSERGTAERGTAERGA